MLLKLKVIFSSRIKLFRKDSYSIEKSDIRGIEVHAFHGKKEVGKLIIDVTKAIDGDFNLDKSSVDQEDWFSYAKFDFEGTVKQSVEQDFGEMLVAPPKVKFKALYILARRPGSPEKDRIALLLNEEGTWEPIDVVLD